MSMAQRVAARYAGRIFNFKPVKLDSCRHCNGDGILIAKALQVKSTCTHCLGTGVAPASVKALQDEVDEITETLRFKKEEFEGIKKKYRGRGSRQLGMMGRDLQTLNGALTDRTKVLEPELPRIELANELARDVGAAAR